MNSGNEPASKQDIVQLRDEMKQDVLQLREETNHQYREVVERIAKYETRVLEAVDTLRESMQTRLAGVERSHAEIREWLTNLEQRLADVDHRLTLTPNAGPLPHNPGRPESGIEPHPRAQ